MTNFKFTNFFKKKKHLGIQKFGGEFELQLSHFSKFGVGDFAECFNIFFGSKVELQVCIY
jgi:hypothetical protein